jgi:hypothetical protein
MRVSDTERQRTVDELRRHCAAGRLDVDEYAGRVEQVLDATTLEELDQVLADLPMMRIADPVGVGTGSYHPVGGVGEGRGAGGRFAAGTSGRPGRLAASAVVILSVVVVVGVVLLALLASWSWVAVLVAGWLIGLIQARLIHTRRTHARQPGRRR